MPRYVNADAAVSRVIRSGQKIFMSGNSATPSDTLKALIRQATNFRDIELIQMLCTFSDLAKPELKGHIRINTSFIGRGIRSAIQSGEADFTTCFLSQVPSLFKKGYWPLDVAIVHTSLPNRNGFCSLGTEGGLAKAPIETAQTIIAEMNDRMPFINGNCLIHVDNIDYIVPASHPLMEFPSEEQNEISKKIGQNAAEIIGNNSVLQLGIGANAEAVLNFLFDRKNLGIHTEVFSDGIIDLVKRGIITGNSKTLHPGKIVTGVILGTKKLYDFVDNNKMVETHPTEYVNDPFIISKNDNMVAINSAMEIDLNGQVCAEGRGPLRFSGVGGQTDFMYGASRSRNGKPIIVMPSIYEKTGESRIVAALAPAASVTTSKNLIHYVVTEFGVARLFGKKDKERFKELINVAHPKFRDDLARKVYEFWKILI